MIEEGTVCVDCGRVPTGLVSGNPVCDVCGQRLGIPPSLLKATWDYFDYALRLDTGEVLFFKKAVIVGDWVFLQTERAAEEVGNRNTFPFERGVYVRLSHVVWVADAPYGS